MQSTVEAVEIELDKPRRLLFTNEAIFRAEREINRMRGARPESFVAIEIIMLNAWRTASENLGVLPMDLVACLLWGACLHEDRALTVNDAVDIIIVSGKNRLTLMEALLEAFRRARPPIAEPGDGEDKKKPAAPTGSGSEASPRLN